MDVANKCCLWYSPSFLFINLMYCRVQYNTANVKKYNLIIRLWSGTGQRTSSTSQAILALARQRGWNTLACLIQPWHASAKISETACLLGLALPFSLPCSRPPPSPPLPLSPLHLPISPSPLPLCTPSPGKHEQRQLWQICIVYPFVLSFKKISKFQPIILHVGHNIWHPIIATSFSQGNSSAFSPIMPEELGEHPIRDQRPFSSNRISPDPLDSQLYVSTSSLQFTSLTFCRVQVGHMIETAMVQDSFFCSLTYFCVYFYVWFGLLSCGRSKHCPF